MVDNTALAHRSRAGITNGVAILLSALSGSIFLHFYLKTVKFFDVDGRGYYYRAIGEIENKINDVYYPISVTYRIFLEFFSVAVSPKTAIVSLNFLFLILGVYFCVKSANILNIKLNNFLIFYFLSTPFSFRYIYYAGKEAFLFLLAAVFLYGFLVRPNIKNYPSRLLNALLLLAIIGVGTWARPYFSAHILVLLIVFCWNQNLVKRLLVTYFILVASVCVHYSIDILAYGRLLFFNAVGFLLSPNFSRAVNWQTPFETVVSCISVFGFFLLPMKRKYFRFLLLAVVYGLPPALVVYFMNINQVIDTYGIFFTRTRFPIFSILFLLLGSLIFQKIAEILIDLRLRSNDFSI